MQKKFTSFLTKPQIKIFNINVIMQFTLKCNMSFFIKPLMMVYHKLHDTIRFFTGCFCHHEDVKLTLTDYYRGHVYDSREDECGSTRTLSVHSGWYYTGGELYLRVDHRNCSRKPSYGFYLYEKCTVHTGSNWFDYWTCNVEL
uniref:C-type lectin domain-containing protein n=1 Tax=Strongyloides papillosus TaxID=174720 RepID=A0A0N5C519_STREA